MKVLVFSPYLYPPHLGGGEKYLLDTASYLAQNHQVEVGISRTKKLTVKEAENLTQIYSQFLGRELGDISFKAVPLRTEVSFWKKLLFTKQYDCIFYLTDGSFFFSLAGKNIAHIQFPLKLDKSKFIDRKKLKNWQIKITNSEFTKSIVEPNWPVQIDLVHQPMVAVSRFSQGVDLSNKQKVILNVGRFFSHLHSKRQDILVDIFSRLLKKHPKLVRDWKLVLIGSVDDEDFAQKVKDKAQGLPVEIYHDLTRQELIDWYQRSAVYWHATGYRVNEQKNPEKVEHFGISTVEAMAAGCAPIVIGKGGQIEVVGCELMEWTWLTQRDCLKKTAQVIRHPDLRWKLQQAAQQQATNFGPEIFQKKIDIMMNY